MKQERTFGIIGGDLRYIHLANELENSNFKVNIYGFDNIKSENNIVNCDDLNKLIYKSDYIILPIPISRDKNTINAPFSSKTIDINKNFLNSLREKVVFGGLTETISNHGNIKIYDYGNREDFKILNAIPTSEGAIRIVMENFDDLIFDSNCLITGFGRIGKILSNKLKSLGANITVSCRKPIDIAIAVSNKYNVLNFHENIKLPSYDIIFNTVPKIIFNNDILKNINNKPLIIDLASGDGGISQKEAEKFDLNCIKALGIPGKYFPKSSAKIIIKVIRQIIKENNL